MKKHSRRGFVKVLSGLSGVVLFGARKEASANLSWPLLDVSDSAISQTTRQTAVALKYVEDGSKSSSRKSPKHKCSTCTLYVPSNADSGACTLFQKVRVKATGWCAGYIEKPN